MAQRDTFSGGQTILTTALRAPQVTPAQRGQRSSGLEDLGRGIAHMGQGLAHRDERRARQQQQILAEVRKNNESQFKNEAELKLLEITGKVNRMAGFKHGTDEERFPTIEAYEKEFFDWAQERTGQLKIDLPQEELLIKAQQMRNTFLTKGAEIRIQRDEEQSFQTYQRRVFEGIIQSTEPRMLLEMAGTLNREINEIPPSRHSEARVNQLREDLRRQTRERAALLAYEGMIEISELSTLRAEGLLTDDQVRSISAISEKARETKVEGMSRHASDVLDAAANGQIPVDQSSEAIAGAVEVRSQIAKIQHKDDPAAAQREIRRAQHQGILAERTAAIVAPLMNNGVLPDDSWDALIAVRDQLSGDNAGKLAYFGLSDDPMADMGMVQQHANKILETINRFVSRVENRDARAWINHPALAEFRRNNEEALSAPLAGLPPEELEQALAERAGVLREYSSRLMDVQRTVRVPGRHITGLPPELVDTLMAGAERPETLLSYARILSATLPKEVLVEAYRGFPRDFLRADPANQVYQIALGLSLSIVGRPEGDPNRQATESSLRRYAELMQWTRNEMPAVLEHNSDLKSAARSAMGLGSSGQGPSWLQRLASGPNLATTFGGFLRDQEGYQTFPNLLNAFRDNPYFGAEMAAALETTAEAFLLKESTSGAAVGTKGGRKFNGVPDYAYNHMFRAVDDLMVDLGNTYVVYPRNGAATQNPQLGVMFAEGTISSILEDPATLRNAVAGNAGNQGVNVARALDFFTGYVRPLLPAGVEATPHMMGIGLTPTISGQPGNIIPWAARWMNQAGVALFSGANLGFEPTDSLMPNTSAMAFDPDLARAIRENPELSHLTPAYGNLVIRRSDGVELLEADRLGMPPIPSAVEQGADFVRGTKDAGIADRQQALVNRYQDWRHDPVSGYFELWINPGASSRGVAGSQAHGPATQVFSRNEDGTLEPVRIHKDDAMAVRSVSESRDRSLKARFNQFIFRGFPAMMEVPENTAESDLQAQARTGVLPERQPTRGTWTQRIRREQNEAVIQQLIENKRKRQ